MMIDFARLKKVEPSSVLQFKGQELAPETPVEAIVKVVAGWEPTKFRMKISDGIYTVACSAAELLELQKQEQVISISLGKAV